MSDGPSPIDLSEPPPYEGPPPDDIEIIPGPGADLGPGPGPSGRSGGPRQPRSSGRVPPHDLRAEESVLGAMLLSREAIADVVEDFAKGQPMDRLVCGDVGFGKTEVALRAAFIMAMTGRQAAVVTPTTLLARQHYKNFSERFKGFPLKIAQLSRMVSSAQTKAAKDGAADGTVDIIIGTHALIQDSVMFSSLGVVVIDEQHRFGVEQRAALREKTASDALPDVLVMTATPIPRTAAMTVYGDLDVSVLDELPPGRTPIVTHWIKASGSLEGEAPLEPPAPPPKRRHRRSGSRPPDLPGGRLSTGSRRRG